MIVKRELEKTKIFNEMIDSNQEYWFDFKRDKFLHNIDTFYYSVKFNHDFTRDSEDKKVHDLRKYFDKVYLKQQQYDGVTPFYLPGIDVPLNIRPFSFAHIYDCNIECPEYFDIFIARKVPNDTTCEIVVQLRSYMLWMYGIYEAFERSYEVVKALADMFGLDIAYAQENRIDYCWHSNYLTNPEKFFSIDNFAKMRVSRIKSATFHVDFRGNEDYEIDYLRLGERGKKIFVRIYLKSKEVVEMGYKAFFFKIWLFNGLINRYDLYCYEECYKLKSWEYLDTARLKYYMEYGQDSYYVDMCKRVVDGDLKLDYDDLKKLADQLTPKINLVINVEYQTMRKSTKSYCLLPLRDNSAKNTCKRIYDYLDNRKLIIDYLTDKELRLVETSGDSNKSRRDYNGFWKALRNTKLVDIKLSKHNCKLVREYNRELNKAILKKRMLNMAVTYGIYNRGINEDNPLQDCVEVLCRLNDNDIKHMKRYKQKKTRQFNQSELSGLLDNDSSIEYTIVDNNTGTFFNQDTILELLIQ